MWGASAFKLYLKPCDRVRVIGREGSTEKKQGRRSAFWDTPGLKVTVKRGSHPRIVGRKTNECDVLNAK